MNSTSRHDVYNNNKSSETRGRSKYNIGQLIRNSKLGLGETNASLKMKSLRLSRQAMDQIRTSRQWKASEKNTTTKVEKFEPIGDDDEVVFGDHNKSRNDLQIKTTELGNFPTQDRLDYMAANWFEKTG